MDTLLFGPFVRGLALGLAVVAALIVAGVFVGSAFWWLLVTGGLSLARTRLSQRIQRVINVTAGLVLVGFGLAAIASVLL